MSTEIKKADKDMHILYRLQSADPWELHQELLSSVVHVTKYLWKIAGILWRIKQESLWKQLGYESFADYCANPEIRLSRAQAYRLIAVWDTYVVKGGMLKHLDKLQDVSLEKLFVTTKVVAGELGKLASGKPAEEVEKEIEEWIEKARSLGYHDLRREVKRATGTLPEVGEEEIRSINMMLEQYIGWVLRDIDYHPHRGLVVYLQNPHSSDEEPIVAEISVYAPDGTLKAKVVTM